MDIYKNEEDFIRDIEAENTIAEKVIITRTYCQTRCEHNLCDQCPINHRMSEILVKYLKKD